MIQEIATAVIKEPVTAVVVDYSGIAAIVTAIGPTIAIIVASIVQVLQLRKTRSSLEEGQAGIHTLVDGASAEQKRVITALKLEIARLARPGESPTTEQKAGEGYDEVGIDQGVVTVEKHGGAVRRIDDPPIPPSQDPPLPTE